jgi:hypothetical protein
MVTTANVLVLAATLAASREARAKDDLPILRGRGLEIVDDQGRLRAQLKVEPADPDYAWPDGRRKGYPETVIFRLITPDGKPRVKLTTSPDGSALMLLGDSDDTRAVLHSERTSSSLLLRDREASQRLLRP